LADEPVPSAGTPTPPSEPAASAPTPSAAPAAPPTIDDLWDRVQAAPDKPAGSPPPDDGVVPEPETPETPEGQDRGEEPEPEKPEGEEPEPPEPEKPLVEEPEPAHLTKALDLLKGYPKLREAIREEHYRLAAYSEVFSTVAEARSYKEVFQTPDDAKVAAERSHELELVDEAFEQDPEGLTLGLAEHEPGKLANWLDRLPSTLAQVRDPRTGQPDTSFYSRLARPFFERAIANLAAMHSEDPADQEAINRVAELAGVGRIDGAPARIDPETDRIRRENETLRARENARGAQQFNSFLNDRNTDFKKELSTRVKAFTERPSITKGFPAVVLAKINEEIVKAVESGISSNTVFINDLHRRSIQGRRDAAHRAELVKSMLARADGLLRQKGAEILGQWTKDYTSSSQQDLARRKTVASRRDAGSGGNAAGASRTGAPVNKPLSQMTPAEKEKYYQGKSNEDLWSRVG
jgi:hypothetical protein